MTATLLTRALLLSAAVYVGLGSAAAAAIHWRGLARLDPATRGAGIGFFILITPGLIALWPIVVPRWFRALRASAVHDPDPEANFARPTTLRRAHALAWKFLALLAPLAVSAALYSRPAPTPDTSLPTTTPTLGPIERAR